MLFYNNGIQKERRIKMPEKTLENLEETKEEKEMLKNKKRNNTNSFGCNNSCAFNTSRGQHKLNIR